MDKKIPDTRELTIKLLKDKFPNDRFTITSIGKSIEVRWVDGPSNDEVKKLLGLR